MDSYYPGGVAIMEANLILQCAEWLGIDNDYLHVFIGCGITALGVTIVLVLKVVCSWLCGKYID